MAKLGYLTSVDIRALIERYSSELRVLDFQASAIKASIKELEGMLGGAPAPTYQNGDSKVGRPAKQKEGVESTLIATNGTSDTPTVKKGPGRPRLIPLEDIKVDPNLPPLPKKAKAPKAEKPAKAAKIKGEKGKKGRKPGFNRWEDAILAMLKDSDQPLKNEDLMEAMQMVADRDNVHEGKAQLKVRLNQALVKLGNKLQLLKKESFPGKGFMYSLK